MHTRQHLDQRGFACAIVADQGHDFTGMNIKIDVGQCRNRPEFLGNAAQAKDPLALAGGNYS